MHLSAALFWAVNANTSFNKLNMSVMWCNYLVLYLQINIYHLTCILGSIGRNLTLVSVSKQPHIWQHSSVKLNLRPSREHVKQSVVTSAIHLSMKCTNNTCKSTNTIRWFDLLFSHTNKTPLKQIVLLHSLKRWKQLHRLLRAPHLKLDWRHKFKLLPFKHNGQPCPLPSNHSMQYP